MLTKTLLHCLKVQTKCSSDPTTIFPPNKILHPSTDYAHLQKNTYRQYHLEVSSNVLKHFTLSTRPFQNKVPSCQLGIISMKVDTEHSSLPIKTWVRNGNPFNINLLRLRNLHGGHAKKTIAPTVPVL